MKHISIKSANYITDYKIKFVFTNGAIKTIDFGSFILNSDSPHTTPYKNKKRFSKFEITDTGDISWDDYNMCFAGDYLAHDIIKKEIPLPSLSKFILKSFSKRQSKKLLAELQ